MDLDFFFEPSCPWTWITSRWIRKVAPQRELQIRWRPLSLACINEAGDVEPKHRVGQQALRLVAALDELDRVEDVDRFYTELGRRWHDGAEPKTLDVVVRAAADSGLGSEAEMHLFDDCWDGPIRARYKEAMDLAGPGVGSPILAFGEPRRGIFGPILSPPPTGEEAAALWDLVAEATRFEGLWELKRGRTVRPSLPVPE